MLNIVRIIIFISGLLLISFNCFAENQSDFPRIKSFAELKPQLLKLLKTRNPEKTLFVLPLETILKPIDEGFKTQDANYAALARKAMLKLKDSQKVYLEEVQLVEYGNKLVDPAIPDLIKTVQDQGCPVIVITSNLSGSYNAIPHLEVWTLDFLQKQGINLTQGMLADKSFTINSMTKVKGTYPTFHKGLLSCNQEDRDNSYHQVLSTFLFGINFLPDTVVMVQNDVNNLNAAIFQLKILRKDIEVVGFLYEAPFAGPSKLSPNEYLSFMMKLVEKANTVRRSNEQVEIENPYEE